MIIGIGEMGHSNNESENIVTHALGSCVAIIFYNEENHLACMSHAVLPMKTNGRDSTDRKPALYGDEAVDRMINLFVKSIGVPLKIKVTLIGGADSRREDDFFKIGERNLKAIKDKLRTVGLAFNAYETGGHFSRTVHLAVKDGQILIKKQKMNF